jgi:deazaflavin-dependent oxidoreductase (nitroreductase family)
MSEDIDWGGMNAPVIEKFREGTAEDAYTFYGQPILLLTTTGAKSGKKRINPLVFQFDNGRLYIIASKGGSPDHPDWYYNVKANPDVAVEMPDETFEATAVEVEDPAERDRIYGLVASQFSNFVEYEQKTDRRIPVVELVRKS